MNQELLGGYQRRTSALVILAALTTALTLFGIFRLSASMMSVAWIGAWSLIQGLYLIGRISDSGAGSNISRVIAVRAKAGESLQLRNFALAALCIASVPSIILTAITAPLIGLFVTERFGSELSQEALWSLVMLGWLNAVIAAITTTLLAVCEGMFLLNYKSYAVIAGNLVGLSVLYPVLQFAGPAGIGWVNVSISLTQLSLAGARVYWTVRTDSRLGSNGSDLIVSQHIRQLWRENLHLSGIALIRISFEPATKLALSFVAPLTVIAQFELALRVTTQIRVLVQSALQPLLVVGARRVSDTGSDVRRTFIKNDRVVAVLSIGGLMAQVFAAPLVQLLGLGSIDWSFISFFIILAAGNAWNTIGLSGYYWQLSSGILAPLVKVQIFMALLNVSVGAFGLWLRSPSVVVGGYAAAFVLGGLTTRSYLTGLATRTKLLAPSMVLVGGAVAAVPVLLLNFQSAVSIWTLFCCAIAAGGASTYAAYRTYRRAEV